MWKNSNRKLYARGRCYAHGDIRALAGAGGLGW